jgi:hypothetical protein
MHRCAVNVSIQKRNDGDMIANEESPRSARWRLAIERVLARYSSGGSFRIGGDDAQDALPLSAGGEQVVAKVALHHTERDRRTRLGV